MAAYSAIAGGEKDADSPITVSLIEKLDQNPHAIAEGASGAPRIQSAALDANIVTLAKMADNSVGQAEIIADSIGQSEIKIATGDTTVTASGTIATVAYVSAAGGYKLSTELRAQSTIFNWLFIDAIDYMPPSTMTTSVGVNSRLLRAQTTGGSQVAVARDVYINASPPYSINGLDFGEQFIFILLDDGGNIASSWIAQDPPWAHNGPTKTRPDLVIKDPNKPGGLKKFVKNLVLPDDYESLDKKDKYLALATAKSVLVEIDESIKNADIDLIPNPFFEYNENKILLIEPDDKVYSQLCEIQKNGEPITNIIHGDFLKLDQVSNVPIDKKPKNTKMIKVKWKRHKIK